MADFPYEIPPNWVWTRFGEVVNLISGQDMSPDLYSENEIGIPYLTGASNINNGKIILNRWTAKPKSIAKKGDLLITCKGTVGEMAFLECEQAHLARQFMAIRPHIEIDSHFVYIFMLSYVPTLKKSTKSMIPGIARGDILQAFFPMPPAFEQQRIANAVKSIFERIDLLE